MSERWPSRSGSRPPLADQSGGDILIVDDFRDTLALYEALLTEDGHAVRTATSGVAALQAVAEREPELVLLDVSMPGMDGVEVLRHLRARHGGGPAVIMLTAARREPEAIESGLREGADAYLTKPIQGAELRARTRAALETFRLRRQLEAQRRDHIAMLVHDLRHPVSSLRLLAELFGAEELSPDERRDSADTIRTICADMARIIDGVLVASRLEAGVFHVEPRPIVVRELLSATTNAFVPLARSRRIQMSVEGDLDHTAVVDPPKFRQALDNVLANAFKFTPKGGAVRFRVAAIRGAIAFEIADSGPGIPEAERGTIFERYRQGARGRAAGGAGLGLAIARGIAEAHGGTIEVGSSDLGGASFRLVLPPRLTEEPI